MVDLNGRAYDGVERGRRGGRGGPSGYRSWSARGHRAAQARPRRRRDSGLLLQQAFRRRPRPSSPSSWKENCEHTFDTGLALCGAHRKSHRHFCRRTMRPRCLSASGAELQWLTGYAAHALPRLTMLVIPLRGRASLIVPRLELPAAQTCTAAQAGLIDLISWEETEDPFELVGKLLDERDSRPEVQLGALGGAWGRLGGLLVSDRLWSTFLLRLQAPDARCRVRPGLHRPVGPADIKDAEEIDLLRKAAHAADRAITKDSQRADSSGAQRRTSPSEVRERLVDEGHDEAAFWIVASGPNSASPHHEPDRAGRARRRAAPARHRRSMSRATDRISRAPSG